MRKQTLLILIFVVLVVILAIVYIFFQYQNIYKICEDRQDVEGCKRLVAACETMSGYEQKICYQSLATALNDSSICDITGKC